MKKHGDNLFKIGEVAKILGVTRKAILLYEDMGLLTPAVKDEKSGFRYYTADNMTQIRSIKSLQALGLSLKEVAEYYYDTKNMDKHLHRLLDQISCGTPILPLPAPEKCLWSGGCLPCG